MVSQRRAQQDIYLKASSSHLRFLTFRDPESKASFLRQWLDWKKEKTQAKSTVPKEVHDWMVRFGVYTTPANPTIYENYDIPRELAFKLSNRKIRIPSERQFAQLRPSSLVLNSLRFLEHSLLKRLAESQEF
jgi:hypothetical protein